MKGLAVLFKTEKKWEQMCEVFQKSWRQHMDIPLEIICVPPPEQENRIYGLDTNAYKLKLWIDNFKEDTIFCDCDMLVRADITDGFDYISDIGYTIRTTKGRPFNAGVIFARHTEYSKEFLAEWYRINDEMHKDEKLRRKYAKIIPGMNQPALACLLENKWSADMIPEEYNICDANRWKQGKMVHIKSEARDICFRTHRKFNQKEYQKALRKTFWAYLGGEDAFMRSRALIEVHKAERRKRMKSHR